MTESETSMARTNPVLSKVFPQQRTGYGPPAGYPAQSGYGPDTGYGTLPPMSAPVGTLTIDDVVVHTAGLLALLVAVAAVAWETVPLRTGLGLVIPAVLLAVGIVIYSGFKRHVSPAMAIGYAVVEGFVVGVISHLYNDFSGRGADNPANHGIVLQAVVATIAVFFGMLALYQTGVIRATPKFRKVIMTATLGIFLTYLASLVMRVFFHAQMPLLNSSSSLGILVSAVIVVVAAMNFILDFDQIERAVAAGAPREFAWAASLGLLVTMVWLYLEMLRLLSKLQRR